MPWSARVNISRRCCSVVITDDNSKRFVCLYMRSVKMERGRGERNLNWPACVIRLAEEMNTGYLYVYICVWKRASSIIRREWLRVFNECALGIFCFLPNVEFWASICVYLTRVRYLVFVASYIFFFFLASQALSIVFVVVACAAAVATLTRIKQIKSRAVGSEKKVGPMKFVKVTTFSRIFAVIVFQRVSRFICLDCCSKL